jgi:hypothetical protein
MALSVTATGDKLPTVTITEAAGSYTVIVSGVADVSTSRVPTSDEHAKGVPYRSHQVTYTTGDPPVEHTATVNDSKIWPVEVVRPDLGEAVRNALEIFGHVMVEAYREKHPELTWSAGDMVAPLMAIDATKARAFAAVNEALERARVAPVRW